MIYGAQDIVPVDVSAADVALSAEAYAIRVTGAGTVAILTRAGVARTLAFAAGETRYVYATRIYKIGTSATGIEAMLPPT